MSGVGSGIDILHQASNFNYYQGKVTVPVKRCTCREKTSFQRQDRNSGQSVLALLVTGASRCTTGPLSLSTTKTRHPFFCMYIFNHHYL